MLTGIGRDAASAEAAATLRGSETWIYVETALLPMPPDADLYDLTALWLEDVQPGWAILLYEMTLGVLAPGSEEPAALDLLERPNAEA